ncbi:metallophosphoesterase family protein [Sphingobacterium faecium]|uniref:metallophosphoesterase family protein n=1 Tax=Sphingobacterium faecium TaxID=34087 RepID=UPI0024692CE0|nr:metallophosphoesterase [Sphingobacterium faecium]MDH5826314.1 metallophosphoesterase [Sphingobacterium faecium]
MRSYLFALLYFFTLILFIHPVFSQVSDKDINKERKNKSLKILVISDLNDSYGSTTYSKEVLDVVGSISTLKPDLILCGGDMVAGQKRTLTREAIQAMWKGFDQAILQPIKASGVPFGFTMGNHDASPSFELDREVSASFWLNHKADVNLTFIESSHFPYYYSYLKNNVFIISWDASSSQIPEQVKSWMKEQLDSPLAKEARFKIVLGHLPLYALVESKNKPGEVLEHADETLQFLEENDVDLYLSGHQHVYYPAQKESVILYHSGCLGGGPRALLGHNAEPYKAYGFIEIPKKIKNKNAVKISAIRADDNLEVKLQDLPTQVSGFNGNVHRIDLAK